MGSRKWESPTIPTFHFPLPTFTFGLLVFLLSLSSCDLFKSLPAEEETTTSRGGEELDPIQGRRVYNPQTGTYEIVEAAPTEKMDTIRWKDVPESTYPPITSTGATTPGPGTPTSNPVQPIGTGEQGSQLLSSYNVSIVLPFLADRVAEGARIDDNSYWALHFYSGMRLGLDELNSQNIKLNVSVMDSEAEEQAVINLLRTNQDLRQAHMIIGPYRRDNVALIANQVKSSGQVLVSPYSAATNISNGNPNYVQVNPTLESHSRAILQHALSRFNPRDIVLVVRNDPGEQARLAYFQEEYRLQMNLRDTSQRLQVLIAGDNYDPRPFLRSDAVAFILPVWDEAFVTSFLRRLDGAQGNNSRTVVYGMPQWATFEGVDLNYFERLNVHISSSIYIDPLDPEVQRFRERFFDRFGAIPREEAYVGYDIARYFGKMINQYGTKFQYQLEKNPEQLLHTKFDFERIVIPTTTAAEFAPIERWENRFVNILEFENYQFRLAR